MLTKKRILSINVSNGTQQDFVDEIFQYSNRKQSSYICFANVHMLVEAYDSKAFNTIVNSADIVAPDGFPVAKSFNIIYGLKQERIDGTGIMNKVLAQCPLSGKKVFFYGGTPEMLDKATIYLHSKYPGLTIAGMYAPPFRPLNEKEKESVINEVISSAADFVFVVLGCPKQEAWMHEMSGKIPAVMLGIGGALPMVLGIQKRAPIWAQKTGFEWLYRLIQEPKRLFHRYAVTNTKFMYLLTVELLKLKLAKIWPALKPKMIV
jgi:N-acetylglucosaminyldiphosphoundecaprenol N-acetyl-beta-D-mannosaminyltransferase